MMLKTFTFGLAAILLTATAGNAANLNWGDLTSADSTVVFRNVTEDNGEATTLFAPASGPTVMADSMMFDPQGFQSQSSNGADLIDSTLSTRIESKQGESINTISIDEFGDYSLGGLSGAEAFASVGAAFFWRVAEVDGVAVSMPTQIASLSVTDGGYFERPGDDGTAVPWTGSVSLDVASYLNSRGITGAATAVTLRFDNTLQTAADEFSNAFIKKKGIDITVNTGDPMIPEPTAVSLLLITVGAACCGRRVG